MIYINNSGVLIKIPKAKTFEIPSVSSGGSFWNYFKIAGEGVNVIPNSDGTKITIILQIECIKAPMPDMEQKIAEYKKARGWDEDNCYYEPGFSSIAVSDDVRTSLRNSLVSSLLNMKVGDTMTNSFTLENYSDSRGEQKKAISKLMAMPFLFLSFNDVLRVCVINSTKKEKNENGYSAYLDL
jgi:hypothetical protein